MTATNSERSFNEALARVLWTKHPAWRERLTAEQHRAVKGGGQPDLIVRNPLGAPVVVETEYLPARTVEQDAIARLGRELADSGYAVEQCIALRAPNALQKTPQPHLDTAAAEARYEYCLFTRTAASRSARLPLYSQAKWWRFHTSAQPSPPVSLRAPRSKQYASPVGSASAGVGSPSSQHRSMKCSCAAERSFNSEARHLVMNSCGVMSGPRFSTSSTAG